MRHIEKSVYGEVPDRVEKALHRLMQAFRDARKARTDEERVRAEANLAKERLEYRRVVDEALKTETLVVA